MKLARATGETLVARITQWIVLALLCLPVAQAQTGAELPSAVSRMLSAYRVSANDISVYVHEIGEPLPVLAVRADVPRNPASVTKLLTTYLTLDELGPTYSWKTQVFTDGSLRDGRLDGDLIIKGFGDPYMSMERLWLMLRELRERGVRDITGDFVIDNSFYDLEGTPDPGAFDNQPFRAYNALPAPFIVNYHAIRFTFVPDTLNRSVRVIADPSPANLTINNNLQLREGRCAAYQRGIAVKVDNPPDNDVITFSGNYGTRCGTYSLSRSVLGVDQFSYGVFTDFWEEVGGTLDGGLAYGQVTAEDRPFLTFRSQSLAEIIRLINKWSSNIMSRQFMLTMGVETFGAPATLDKGRRALELALDERGIPMPGMYVENGSGLSRDTRLTARGLGAMLIHADASNYAAEFQSSLSLAGMDGTLRRQLRERQYRGRFRLKSGRLEDVFAVAGYVRSRSGREHVVVVLQNYRGANRGPGQEIQNALLKWVYLR